MKSRVGFALLTSGILLALLGSSYLAQYDAPDNTQTRFYLINVLIAATFPLALIVFAASQRIDGFSFGSIVFAAILETVLYIGWAASPQEEADRFFYFATILPLVLIVVTLLFNALQRET